MKEPNFIVGPNYKLLPEKVNKEKKPLSVALTPFLAKH